VAKRWNMADNGKSADINIDALKKSVDRIEEKASRWFNRVLEKRLTTLPSPFRLSRWVISLLRLLAYTLLLFLFIVLSVIISVAGTLVKAVGWWWEKLKKDGLKLLLKIAAKSEFLAKPC
jgi:hypothetical protein